MKQILVECLVVILSVGLWACGRRAAQEVMVYTSVDDVFARLVEVGDETQPLERLPEAAPIRRYLP